MAGGRAGLLVQRVAVVAVLVVAVVAGIMLVRSGGSDRAEGEDRSSASSASANARAAMASTVRYAALPGEAQETIGRVRAGGPFPYSRDGVVFENREGLLPNHPSGYYHEYTVATPGQADRGPRRIVQASDGTLYWSPDHYQTFRQITDLPDTGSPAP